MGIQIRPIQTSGAMWAESRPILRGLGMICLALGLGLLVIAACTAAQKYTGIKQWTPAEALVLQFQLPQSCARDV